MVNSIKETIKSKTTKNIFQNISSHQYITEFKIFTEDNETIILDIAFLLQTKSKIDLIDRVLSLHNKELNWMLINSRPTFMQSSKVEQK